MLGALGAQIEAAEPPPSAELLLYLGEFEDASGEFVDPMALDETKTQPAIDAPADAPRIEEEDDDEPAPHSA
ncbi:MAG TPA: hypothetical protein VN259_11110 [Xanthomonadales bacterium]|nr:hypothetical protein [Xanthomonadales bacterium]